MVRSSSQKAADADLEYARIHPDGQLKEMLGGFGTRWTDFNHKPIDADYWQMWATYLDFLFREAPGPDQRRAIFVELRRRGMTNVMLRAACNFIIRTRRQWPFVSDFLDDKIEEITPSIRE